MKELESLSPPLFRSPAFQALLAAGIMGLFLLIDFFLIRPGMGMNHAFGVFFTRLATMAAIPGLMAARILFVNHHHVMRADMTSFYLVATGVTCVWVWMVTWLVFRVGQRARERREADATGRRTFLRRAAWGVAGSGALLGGYTVLVEPGWLRIVHIRLPLAGLPASLSGMKVAHLTDLHLGRYVSAGQLRSVVQETNQQRPDLVVLTGDYVHGSPGFIRPVFQILTGLKPRLGSVGVLGNHDHWESTDESFAQMRAAGIHVLDNRLLFIGADGLTTRAAPGTGLFLAGLGDLWEDTQDLDVLADAPADMPRLLLSHNPDFTEGHKARAKKHRVDLMLAGHTHGGQVRLPGTRSIITPSRYGSKYARGMVQGPAFPVFISTGIGMTILPVRLLVRPEIVIFTLVPKGAGSPLER